MGDLKITVVMKSDLAGFTRASGLMEPAQLGALLDSHLAVARASFSPHGGTIVKGEGDAFWVTFPSVAAAARAAVAMREALRALALLHPDTALGVRFAITVGDVLHQDGDIFGPAVNLAARIEAITPRDTIHVDDAAWSALGDREFQGEISESFVPKGFDRTVTTFRIEPRGRVRRFTDEVVMFTNMRGFTRLVAEREEEVDLLQGLVGEWDRLHQQVSDHGGRVRVCIGDSFMLMLPDVDRAVAFFRGLHRGWSVFRAGEPRLSDVGVTASVNVGDYLFFGTTVVGRTINDSARAVAIAHQDRPDADGVLVLTAQAAARLSTGTHAPNLRRVPVTLKSHHTLGEFVWVLDVA